MYNYVGILEMNNQAQGLCLMMLAAYLLGNISPAILIGKAKGVDIRKEGSGNAGTTNVLRVLGKRAAVFTLLVDILKGTIPVVVGGLLIGQTTAMFCVLGAFLGHVWPVIFDFRGGKGVATAFGGLCGLNPLLGLSCLGVVIILVALTRRISVGSIGGALLFPLLAYFIEPDFIMLGSILAVIVIWKHKANIARLVKGEEPKLNFKK